jgi:hypothetical protein
MASDLDKAIETSLFILDKIPEVINDCVCESVHGHCASMYIYSAKNESKNLCEHLNSHAFAIVVGTEDDCKFLAMSIQALVDDYFSERKQS